jgi:hypothetical protein
VIARTKITPQQQPVDQERDCTYYILALLHIYTCTDIHPIRKAKKEKLWMWSQCGQSPRAVSEASNASDPAKIRTGSRPGIKKETHAHAHGTARPGQSVDQVL